MSEASCNICEINFSVPKNYYRHVRRFHPDDKITYNRANAVCSICDEKFPSLPTLQSHIDAQHIKLNFQDLTFYSGQDFMLWKAEIEKGTCSQFVKHSGEKECDEGQKTYYYCSRSGCAKEKLKRKTSVKFGKSCPASIVVLKKENNSAVEVSVRYQSHHVGHGRKIGKFFVKR